MIIVIIVSLCAGIESGVPSSESSTVTSIPAVEKEANLLAGKEAREARRARIRKMSADMITAAAPQLLRGQDLPLHATNRASDLGSRPGLRGPVGLGATQWEEGKPGRSSLRFLIPDI